ncbi:unnamed protein product [Closterium sp. NIES-65]|nr:unnamed protein product [Closterium sp. NIES-65]
MPVRFGILGTARIAQKVIRSMQCVPGVIPYAIGSRSYERAAQFAKEVGMAGDAAIYGSYADVIADPLVDAVYIPLPTALHVEWVVKAANHGKHILLEKPVSLNAADLETMIAAVDSAGVQIMDGTMWMHNPRAAEMKAAMQDRESFGQLMRRLEFAGSLATITLEDFCIPFQEDKAEFVIEKGSKWPNPSLGVKSTVERRETVLTWTQEANMIAELARIVRGVREGGGKAALVGRWVDMMERTQRVVCAVHDSVAGGGVPVLIEAGQEEQG